MFDILANAHAWLVTHPIALTLIGGLVVGLFLSPISIWSTEIKSFISIPPQRLNVWALKARLAGSELKSYHLKRRHQNLRYFLLFYLRHLLQLFYSLSTSIWCVGAFVLMSSTGRHMNAGLDKRMSLFALFGMAMALYWGAISALRIINAMHADLTFAKQSDKLVLRIARLRRKIESKSISSLP
ncbi:MAG TPA: hypothetical protein VME86_04045 [Acidobacteriaceae bacterium]|nr:hypothetical protein [Acidobacteriaceae bacterium]